MRWIIIGVVVLLCGCESMPRGEMYFQGMHAVDVLQTINGPADDDCYVEGNSFTRRLISEKPSRGRVLAWGIGKSALHYGVSKYLDSNAPSWTLTVWQVVTTGNVAITIHDSYKLGVKPWGDNDHSKQGDHWCND